VKTHLTFLSFALLLTLTSSELSRKYHFHTKLVYQLKTGVTDPQQFTFYLGGENDLFGFRPDKSTGDINFMVVEKNLMTQVFIEIESMKFHFTLDLNDLFEKYGEEIPIGLVAVEAAPPSMEEFEGKFIRTGRKKTICGIIASQYRITSRDGFIDLWIGDVGFDTRIFKTLFNLADLPKLALSFTTEKNPLLLEAVVQSINQEPLHFLATAFVKENFTFQTSAYESIDISDMQGLFMDQLPDRVSDK
jgi:hypothetical protein